jgi:competence protein ComEC
MLFAAAAAWATAAAGTLLPVSVAVGSAVAGALLAGVVRHRAAVVAFGVGMAIAAISTAVHVHALHTGPVADLAARHAEVEVIARLVRDPQPLVSGSGAPFTLVDATVVEVLGERAQHTSAPVLLLSFGSGWDGLLPGQRVDVSGRLEPPRPHDDVAAVVDVRGKPRPIGRPVWWQRAAGHVRSALLAACDGLPADPRGLLPGLVDGDTTRVPDALQTDMRATGLTHLEAVSGENLTIVLGVVMALARGAGLRRRSRVVVAALAVVAFVWLARPSPSVLRAAVMTAVALLAMYAGRRTSALPTLSLAVVVLVVIDPFLARSVGFVLSVVATAAIVVISPGWTRRLERTLPRPLAIAIAVPAAAQLACTPVLVLAFGQLTPYAIPANLIAGPAVAPATVLGLISAVLASASVGLARPLVWLGALPTACIAWTAHGFAALPGAAIALSRPVAVATAVATAGLLWRIVKRRVGPETREIL